MNSMILPTILVATGSLLHLFWNYFQKVEEKKLLFITRVFLLIFIYCLVLFPFLNIDYSLSIVAYSFIGGFLMASYLWSLSMAYRFSDLSFVYPTSRAIAAVLTVVVGISFLRESPSLIGYTGISLTLLALFLEMRPGKLLNANSKSIRYIFQTGLFIFLYFIVHKMALEQFLVKNYLWFLFIFTFSFLLFFNLLDGEIKDIVPKRQEMPKLLLSSLCLGFAYITIISAISLTYVSYVVSLRSVGIVASVFVGSFFLNENLTLTRLTAAFLIALGSSLVSIS